MIVLDTHIWLWWVAAPDNIEPRLRKLIARHESTGLGVSAISCWEVAKKVQMGKLVLDRPVVDWMKIALDYPGVQLLPLTPQIVLDSCSLPGEFHKDPADQLIVATARVLKATLVSVDENILAYPHVKKA